MKADWKIKPLGEVATLNYGKALSRSDRDPNGSIPVYGANGILDWSEHTLVDGPSYVIGRKGSAGEVTRVDGPFWPSDVTYFTSHDAEVLNFEFLGYLLETLELTKLARGVKPGINRNDVYACSIPLPPLEEQQRIVAVLDEAFEGLTRAREHAEANLRNVAELFESFREDRLTPLISNENWCRVRLGDVATLQRGFDLPKRLRMPGTFPLVTSSGPTDTHSEPKVSGPGVVTGRSGSIGNVFFIKEDFWPLNTALYVRDFHANDPHFIFHLLSHFDLSRFASGTGVPTLNRNDVHDEIVVVPKSADEQAKIAGEIQQVFELTKKVEKSLIEKLRDMEDLRQSLLQRAFAGELT